MIGLLGREMASIYLWNDSFGGSSLRGPRMIVLLGRERASIYLWNDSFDGGP